MNNILTAQNEPTSNVCSVCSAAHGGSLNPMACRRDAAKNISAPRTWNESTDMARITHWMMEAALDKVEISRLFGATYTKSLHCLYIDRRMMFLNILDSLSTMALWEQQ